VSFAAAGRSGTAVTVGSESTRCGARSGGPAVFPAEAQALARITATLNTERDEGMQGTGERKGGRKDNAPRGTHVAPRRRRAAAPACAS
jgi:hypothetical protein